MRHRRMQAPINSIKHYVPRTNVGVNSGAILNETIVESVVAPATTNAFEVKEGSIVKAVYIEAWIQNSGATSTINQFNVALEKLPGNSADMTVSQSLNLGGYPNKKNILFAAQGNQGAAEDGVGGMPVLRNWVLIPKGKQRFGLGDKIVLNVTSTGQTLNLCGISTYKEYS